jgi:hypothetical protein
MRIPRHGHGSLRIGGTNKGGPGRPRDEFKTLLRNGALEATKRFRQIVAHSESEASVIKAGTVLITTAAPKQIEDVTPQEPARLAATSLLEAIPRLLGILPGAADKVKLLQAIEADSEIVS